MKKWSVLESARTPDGKNITLNEHDGHYVIRVDSAELMSTRRHASEDTLAELACADAATSPAARVLIGGLGFGFTLSAALGVLAADASVVVAEILPEIIAWNQSLDIARRAMSDPRVAVVQRDVADVIREAGASFDSIILDVDNGPDGLSSDQNDRLYDFDGLKRTRAALRAGGCVAYWSASPSAAFEKLMLRAGFQVEVHRARPHPNSGGWHTLFVGRTAPVKS